MKKKIDLSFKKKEKCQLGFRCLIRKTLGINFCHVYWLNVYLQNGLNANSSKLCK